MATAWTFWKVRLLPSPECIAVSKNEDTVLIVTLWRNRHGEKKSSMIFHSKSGKPDLTEALFRSGVSESQNLREADHVFRGYASESSVFASIHYDYISTGMPSITMTGTIPSFDAVPCRHISENEGSSSKIVNGDALKMR